MCIHTFKSNLMVCCSLICVFVQVVQFLHSVWSLICFFSLFCLYWSRTCTRFVLLVWRELSISTSLSSRATCTHQGWSWPVGVTQGGTRKGYPSVVCNCIIDLMSLYGYFIEKKLNKLQRNLQILQGLPSDFKIINFKLFF